VNKTAHTYNVGRLPGGQAHKRAWDRQSERRVIETTDRQTDRGTKDRTRAREMSELLQELRVILPGVQVLFAFLLTVAFSQRFTALAAYQKGVYFAALLSTALATVFFLAPASQHRLLWRQHARSQRLQLANALTILGSLFLAVGVSCVVFLVADFIYGGRTAAVATLMVAGAFLVLWYALPLVQRSLR
jgi:cation transport ATPase